ncbi:aminoglycoside phosphotransferase [Cellulomonas marina]|uniref:Maltokinase n=1 Tax=Cellulomonas marina TaxID=988821 RepID=A0A1I0YKH4_9CELL|nr:aminoglycoside phosphotransferase [Cellulomonas marina]GIG30684.1 trehalose biosynthesis protein [Cellulomonas marina]SFB13889.1 maltokinase [Cellulomonas marina]
MIVLDPPRPDDEELLALVRAWAPARRWYPAKGVDAEVSVVASADLSVDDGPKGAATPIGMGTADARGDVRVRLLLVRVLAPSVDVTLQVPLVLVPAVADPSSPEALENSDAPSSPAEPDPGLLGQVGAYTVREGAGDPAFLRAWLAVADGPGADLDVDRARVLRGEQSNTSVVLPGTGGDDGAPVGILKVLRAVQAGENPDVDVPRRLVDAGWDGVPAPLAWLEGTWPDPRDPAGPPLTGYLAALAAFVPAAEDGFELACAVAREGGSFADEAAALGRAVAGMHAALARAYGVEATADGGSDPAVVADALATRWAWASAAVPALAPYEAPVAAVVERLRSAPTAPPRQRVHGDLHLGQVLRSVDRWFITDFEGEPLAPLGERTRPDLAVRDVAGMLRSLDYAAAVGGLTGTTAQAWADTARGALLGGYAGALHASAGAHAEGEPPAGSAEDLFLTAMELDKTLYEAVYEARNRPDWLPIPLAGLDRLLDR